MVEIKKKGREVVIKIPEELIAEFTENPRIIGVDVTKGTRRFDRAIFEKVTKEVLSNPEFAKAYEEKVGRIIRKA